MTTLLINRVGKIHYCEKCFNLYATKASILPRPTLNWKTVNPKVAEIKCSCCRVHGITSQWDSDLIDLEILEDLVDENTSPLKKLDPLNLDELFI